MTTNSYVVGICGGTCSGKTTLARSLHESLQGDSVYISQDSYYKDQSHKSEEDLKKHNFDHPDSLELDLLYDHILMLKSNKSIDIPTYCFKSHSRQAVTEAAHPSSIVIVEGILTFSHVELRNIFDLRIYVDVDADVRLARRINRDSQERSRDINSILNQYLYTVKPMHDEFVEKYKVYSDLLITPDTFDMQLKNLSDELQTICSGMKQS